MFCKLQMAFLFFFFNLAALSLIIYIRCTHIFNTWATNKTTKSKRFASYKSGRTNEGGGAIGSLSVLANPGLHAMNTMVDHMTCCCDCSAGCGRTGVLCVIDYTWNLLKKKVRHFSLQTFFKLFSARRATFQWCACHCLQIIAPEFSIFGLVQNMRTQRPSLVQTKVAIKNNTHVGHHK